MHAEKNAEVAEKSFDDVYRATEQAHEAIQAIRNGLVPLEEGKSHVRDRFERNKGELLSVQVREPATLKLVFFQPLTQMPKKTKSEHRSIHQLLTAVKTRIQRADSEIALERKRLDDVNGGAHARKAQELEEARAQATEEKIEFDRHREARAGLETDLRNAQSDLRQVIGPVEMKKAEIRQCEDTLRSLQRDQGQHMSAFHERMPHLLRAIRDEPGFREKPIGPVGNHIRLLKPEWSSILEKALGGTLSGFIVTSKQDQNLLSDLMKRVNWSVLVMADPVPVENDRLNSSPAYVQS